MEGNIDKIERVQRKASRIPIRFDKLEYEDRFKRFILKDKLLRGDLIEMNKMMSSREIINWVKPLNLREIVDISELAASIRGSYLNLRI